MLSWKASAKAEQLELAVMGQAVSSGDCSNLRGSRKPKPGEDRRTGKIDPVRTKEKPRAGIADICELPSVDDGNQTWGLCNRNECWIVSPISALGR